MCIRDREFPASVVHRPVEFGVVPPARQDERVGPSLALVAPEEVGVVAVQVDVYKRQDYEEAPEAAEVSLPKKSADANTDHDV